MRTPLYDAHLRAGARMVDFAGWEMPVQYAGVIAEHLAVRGAAGIFDVSHMGQLLFTGPDAVAAVNRLITNDLQAVGDGRAQYTCICNDAGRILDDAISYRLGPGEVLMVVNASNREKIAAHVATRIEGEAAVQDVSADWALVALQGPSAPEIAARVLPWVAGMRPFRVRQSDGMIAATTGYTGEPGFELFVPPDRADALWTALLDAGQADGLVPAGLGARDTLRLEMAYSLYGNDIDETTHPLEAGLGWVTRLDKPGGFVGRDALAAIEREGMGRRLVGLEVVGRGIARHGYRVLDAAGSRPVGQVTSGTQSPSTGKAIALAYVDVPHHTRGTSLQIEVRGRGVEARVTRTPFYRKPEAEE